jgi:hypothetical protein
VVSTELRNNRVAPTQDSSKIDKPIKPNQDKSALPERKFIDPKELKKFQESQKRWLRGKVSPK